MFTGIIEELGTIKSLNVHSGSALITVSCSKICSDISLGDSIAVNGVCLTATSFSSDNFQADVSQETLQRSTLANLKSGSRVNLERALSVGSRFGGHIVQGHVDGIGKINKISKVGNGWEFNISIPKELNRFVVEKGSISIDGISLTVAEDGTTIKVAVIPHTYDCTNLHLLNIGDQVNVEIDIFAKYIDKMLAKRNPDEEIDEGLLRKHGFID